MTNINDRNLRSIEASQDVRIRVFRNSMKPWSKAGPISLVRLLFNLGKEIGCITMTYHLMDPIEPLRAHPSFSHFGRSRVLSRKRIAPEMEASVVLTHSLVLKKGVPTTIASLLPTYMEHEPERTKMVMARLEEVGIKDELMIPVFGPNALDAVVSFGFPRLVSEISPWRLELLESAAQLCHAKLVRHFKAKQPRVRLSQREKLVLTWIARGKSNSEIATILDLSQASVDTYVRRIFEKLDVNNRVSAAIRGLLISAISV